MQTKTALNKDTKANALDTNGTGEFEPRQVTRYPEWTS